MKSLLIVTENFDVGGLETHIRGEIIALTKAGWQVHLATGSRFSNMLVPSEIISVTNNLHLGSEATLADFTATVEALRHLIREHAIDYVHAHPFISLLPSLIAAEMEQVPFTITLHGPASLNHQEPLYDFFLTSVLLPQVSLVTTVSDEVTKLITPYVSPANIFTLPNGVPINNALPVAHTDLRWLVVSRLDTLKIIGILDFIKKAKAAGIQGVLLIGDGPARSDLQQHLIKDELEDFVEFYGNCSDIYAQMQTVAGIAGMGRVVLEGVANRKPVCLIGYDGVKGFVNPELLTLAAHANFSGRNLNNIDQNAFNDQFANLSDTTTDTLHAIVCDQYSETYLWTQWIKKLETINPQPPTLLGDCYRNLLIDKTSSTLPFLQSHHLFREIEKLVNSPLYFDPALVSSFLHCRVKFMDTKLTERDEQITALNDRLSDQNNQITSLNDLLSNRDKQIVSLSKTITEIESAKVLQQKNMMQLSDWASKISAHPIRYGVMQYIRAIAKALYHLIPLSLSHKHALRTRITQIKSSTTAQPMDAIEVTSLAIQLVEQTAGNQLWHTQYLYADPITHSKNDLILNGRDIFIFSVIDWDFRIQRPQHLARSFAKAGQRVFFFSNHFIDSPIAGYEIQKLDPALELYQIKLHVSGAPAIYFAPPTDDALSMIQQGITQLMFAFASLGSISVIQHAYWFPLVRKLPNTLRIYDCMDHHEGFGNVPEKLIAIEKTMLNDSDLVVVTSTWLETLAQKHNANVAVIRNAGEYEHFCSPPTIIYQDPANRQIIGYFGAIAEWFDLELIQSLAQALPDALILLVGNDTINATKALKKLPNVILTGEVPYDQLPFYVHAFDVCLLPFQIIPLTMATNPVKVYEYLAASKPVVSVDLPEIAQFGNLVKRAKTHPEFIDLVSESLASSKIQTESEIPLRLAFAQEQTWDHRIQALTEVIQHLQLPKISIVVLTYNNLDLTKKCLDSLLRWNDYPNTEIIVVDNASTDESPEYLRKFQIDHPESLVILNDQNLGFSAGNNVGLKVATGDYLVILNNDTVVTPGWLLTMLRHLQADPTIGLIGPVTNNIGNEAKISVQYETFDEMLPLAFSQITTHMGKHFQFRTAAFFCTMIPRTVFEKVGYLDENFGLGFFEDDDYCRRVEQLGLKIVCAEDVFIHHHLSASFNKLKSSTRQSLFDTNKAYYESKWGQWFAHEYRQ